MRPTYLPTGYSLFYEKMKTEGELWLGRDPGQSIYVYTTGRSTRELGEYLLAIDHPQRHAPPMIGTGARGGIVVGSYGGESIVYEDGWWAPDRGQEEFEYRPGAFVHWDTTRVHSVVLTHQQGTAGVRARKPRVPLAELIQILQSMVERGPA